MTASERRILIKTFVGKALSEVMDTSKEGVCVACFDCTGLLITVISNEIHDSKIIPQEMEKETFHIPIEPVNSLYLVEEPEEQSEEESVVAEENEKLMN